MTDFELRPKYRDEDKMGTVTILCGRCEKDGQRGDIREDKIRNLMRKGWLCAKCKALDPVEKVTKKGRHAGSTEQG